MPVRVSCSCGRTLNLADALRGKNVRCPECSAAITVPAAESNAAPPGGKSPPQQNPVPPRRAPGVNQDPQQAQGSTIRPAAKPKASAQPKKPTTQGQKRRSPLNPDEYADSDDAEWLDDTSSPSWDESPYGAVQLPGRSSQGSKAGKRSGATARSSGKSGMSTVVKVLLIVAAVSIVPIVIVIGFVVLRSVGGGGSSGAGIPDVANVKVQQDIFPQRPTFQPSFPSIVFEPIGHQTGKTAETSGAVERYPAAL